MSVPTPEVQGTAVGSRAAVAAVAAPGWSAGHAPGDGDPPRAQLGFPPGAWRVLDLWVVLGAG